MNKTKIEWCDSTWNPVTGCLHGCPYCYAEKIANRFGTHLTPLSGKNTAVLDKPDKFMLGNMEVKDSPYPFDFLPTFHRYRLGEPARKTKGQTIFVCSMADLFGKWVPLKWIVEVLDTCRAAPQHRYLFLTKNPERYVELDKLALLPREDNFWYGSTVTKANDEAAWVKDMNCHWFVSMEPLLEGVDLSSGTMPNMPEWIIVGAETGNRKHKVTPKREWVELIVDYCKESGIPVFMKNSMKPIWGDPLPTQFPWEV